MALLRLELLVDLRVIRPKPGLETASGFQSVRCVTGRPGTRRLCKSKQVRHGVGCFRTQFAQSLRGAVAVGRFFPDLAKQLGLDFCPLVAGQGREREGGDRSGFRRLISEHSDQGFPEPRHILGMA